MENTFNRASEEKLNKKGVRRKNSPSEGRGDSF
jgi:hypothetical protein